MNQSQKIFDCTRKQSQTFFAGLLKVRKYPVSGGGGIPSTTRPAFTITELLIVVTIMALLAGIGFATYPRLRARAKLARVTTDLESINSAASQYYQDNQFTYPADQSRGVPGGLSSYLAGGVFPTAPWTGGTYDWDNYTSGASTVQQVSFHLCGTPSSGSTVCGVPNPACAEPILFSNFGYHSSIFYCVNGTCSSHASCTSSPGYCVNCRTKTYPTPSPTP
jgi:prepilin-type N-terminal cleavage/methylation domain-containing protein